MDNVKIVGVIGLGTMGRSIAKLCLSKELEVIAMARTPESSRRDLDALRNDLSSRLRKGKLTQEQFDSMLARIRLASSLRDFADVPIIIEAIYENIDSKGALYRALEPHVSPKTIISTNTSSISVNELSQFIEIRSRFIGLHFFNPAEVMRLVELKRADQTSDETIASAKSFVESLGKTPIITPDLPGLFVNRVLFPMLLEAISVLETTKCKKEDIDTAMKLGANLPMGPLELCDFIGNDIVLSISNVLLEHTGDLRFKPPRLLEQMVMEGKLGRKTNVGFYEYK